MTSEFHGSAKRSPKILFAVTGYTGKKHRFKRDIRGQKLGAGCALPLKLLCVSFSSDSILIRILAGIFVRSAFVQV
jgi:hypothetical protein